MNWALPWCRVDDDQIKRIGRAVERIAHAGAARGDVQRRHARCALRGDVRGKRGVATDQ
jgi:hypothetical protein